MSPAQIGVAGGEASGFDGAGIAVLFDADVGLFQGGPIGPPRGARVHGKAWTLLEKDGRR